MLSDKALSAIRNYLEGRLALYNWVTQHHKVVYADEVLKRAVGALELEGENDILSQEIILRDCVGDSYIIESLRSFSASNSDSMTHELFERYQRRAFAASCWKHRLDYVGKLQSRQRAQEFDKIVDNNAEQVEEQLNNHFGASDDIWVVNSNVPQYEPARLRKIYISGQAGDTTDRQKRSVEELDLYEQPKFLQPTPFVYCDQTPSEDVIEYVNAELDALS